MNRLFSTSRFHQLWDRLSVKIGSETSSTKTSTSSSMRQNRRDKSSGSKMPTTTSPMAKCDADLEKREHGSRAQPCSLSPALQTNGIRLANSETNSRLHGQPPVPHLLRRGLGPF